MVFSDRNADTIKVVERKDGKRVSQRISCKIHFPTMKTQRGKYKSTTGKPT